MHNNFNVMVDQIQQLSIEEKEELRFLLERYLIEAHRDEFYKNYRKSQIEQRKKKLKFSSSVEELQRMIKE
jgi:hypothetical protein